MSEIGDAALVALGEVVALEHPRDRHLRGHLEHRLHVHATASHAELRTISSRSGDGSRMRVACSM